MPDLEAAEQALVDLIAGYADDPLGYVLAAFPWREPGTVLAGEDGPRNWQREVLAEIGDKLRAGGDASAAIHEAVASGHGIGKSALVAWITLWAISTRENTRGFVTANTEIQLRTKTWPEVRKWHGLAINGHWFACAATSLHAASAAEKTWRMDALPWSEHHPEAFAGLHNKGNRILVIFDEASSIPDAIWEVTEGALTDEQTEIIWAVFGNPTRNAGRFRQCFGSLAHRWGHRQIDSRTVPGTNKQQIADWITDYGEDSDFVRVRVRGVFPRAGSMQLIPSDIVALAAAAIPNITLADPLVLGVDVGRFGDDPSVITTRRGQDARTFPSIVLRGADTMTLVGRIAQHVAELQQRGYTVDAIFVDETGVGAGVVDRLRQLGLRVFGVNNGGQADGLIGAEAAANKGAECWCRMKEWARTGGAIEDDPELRAELEGREYGYDVHNRITLEKKSDMKKRGLGSPDRADSLAVTFAHPIIRAGLGGGRTHQAVTDFDPFTSRTEG